MGNKIIDGTVEWIKDADSGDVVGYKRKDGTERGIVSTDVDPLTGVIEFLAGSDAVISSGTAAPNDADGKPDGSIYFQI